ncbi:protein SRG1 [Sesamum indicum]|uniref:Protein SRG1 n=1 Tax=Sesamum indicum TaxID=4182 RepID=A0A8M8V093_SESIN|nr:protein SRG1 [Sesamum indicum]
MNYGVIYRNNEATFETSTANIFGFQAVNHGIESSFLDQVRELAREFFHLPTGEKQKYARPSDNFEGYGNDMVLFDNQLLDWVDRLYLLVHPQDQQKLRYWPENPVSFRDMLYDYTARLRHIENQLLKAMARSLSLPEDSFVMQFGERPSMYARFNYYPPCARPDLVVGLKPHADGSGITILLQDEQVEGLQLLKDNQWFRVPIMPYALVVNVGDQLEIMSNGIFKSPVHRALTNSTRERNTFAMFCAPDPAKEIGPVEELVDERRPRAFKKIKNYTESYFHYYQQVKRPIDAVRV